jgi:hypothetical protein
MNPLKDTNDGKLFQLLLFNGIALFYMVLLISQYHNKLTKKLYNEKYYLLILRTSHNITSLWMNVHT